MGNKLSTWRVNNNTASASSIAMQLINFEVFKQSEETCIGINSCLCLSRIANAMKLSDATEANKFVEFCLDRYPQCLDDYIHLICVHSDARNKICDYLKTHHKINKCVTINECVWTQRHYSNRDYDINDELKYNQQDDGKYNFYTELFDTVHFYLFHLEDLALRCSIEPTGIEENIYHNHADYLNCIDNTFVKLQTQIKERHEKYASHFPRLNNDKNSKFVIQQTQQELIEPTAQENTFMDNVFDYIQNKASNNEENVLIKLKVYIDSEEYDTESVTVDIDIYYEESDCNLLNATYNVKFIQWIRQFIKHYKVSSNSFSTGFTFWYHEYYKHVDDQQMKQQQISRMNQDDFDKHKMKDLYVKPHFNSLKDEASNSPFVNMAVFRDKVIYKTNKYMVTDKCKKIQCIFGRYHDADPLHYGIQYQSPVKQEHLQSVILYCDFTEFCSHFSSTFRKEKWTESIQSVAKRNSKYFYISKYLRELVQYYGTRNAGFVHETDECGPFFTGISVCMNIPSFSIRLRGPTSASIFKEIAIRFSGSDGMILQMNNKKWPGKAEVFFNCSFITAFPEEEERIFCGGCFQMEVESIYVVDTKNNYEEIINAFYKFDAILSGQLMDPNDPVAKKDISVIRSLIRCSLDYSSYGVRFDQYMIDTFYLFVNSKTQIILNMEYINDITDSSFVDLIMYELQMHKHWEINDVPDNNVNLFRPV
eukprot:114973_1